MPEQQHYEVQAPDGRKFDVQGDSPPTEADLDEIFSHLNGTTISTKQTQSSPSLGSLAWTALKTAASDIVSPITSNVGNAVEREKAGNAALNAGDYLGAAKNYALENPVVNTIGGIVNAHLGEAGKAVENAKAGRYSEALGHGAAAALPVVGPLAAAVGEDIGSGDPQRQAQAAGHVLAAVAGPKVIGKTAGLISEGASRLSASVMDSEASAPNLLLKAIGPSNMQVGLPPMLPRAMSDIKAVEQAKGRPIASLDDFLEDIQTAKRQNRQQYGRLTDQKSQMGATVDTTPVAEAIRASIPTRTKMMDPAKARAIEATAKQYDARLPVETVDTLLRDVNGELDSYYAKNPAGRASAQTNPDTAGLVAEAKALRTQLYKTLDDPGNGAAARELQQRYGALSEVERTAQRQIIKQARQLPDNLTQTLGKMQAVGGLVKGAVKLPFNPIGGVADIVKGLAESKMADYVRAQQTTDALIRRAMGAWKQSPTPIDLPPPTTIRGLLTRPATPLGPVPSGPEPPMAVRGQYGARWTPPPAQIPAGPSQTRGLLERGAIPVGPATKPQFFPPSESKGIPLGGGQVWFPAPDEWEMLRETPKPGQLSTVETRELQRIQDELEAMPFQKKFSTETGAYGQKEWHAGSGGAPVYDDILDAPDAAGFGEKGITGIGRPTRGKMIEDIRAAIEGKRISRVAARAIVVARARAVGGYPTVEPPPGIMGGSRLSSPKLPPWWEQ